MAGMAVPIALRAVTALTSASTVKNVATNARKALSPDINLPEQKPTLIPDEDRLRRAARRKASGRQGSRQATTVLSQTAESGGNRLGP